MSTMFGVRLGLDTCSFLHPKTLQVVSKLSKGVFDIPIELSQKNNRDLIGGSRPSHEEPVTSHNEGSLKGIWRLPRRYATPHKDNENEGT
jgi:hypothetical protein